MRTSSKKINSTLKKSLESLLAQTIVDIKNPEEAETFLNSFMTDSEVETFTKRLAVAYWLKKGRSYNNIKENLKVSSATISTVQSILGKKGVQEALRKIEAEEWANQWSEKIKKFVGK